MVGRTPHGWRVSRRREQLPADWPRRVADTRRRAGGRCERVVDGVRCPVPGAECDHIDDPQDHDRLQWLCLDHHRDKTRAESAAASRAAADRLRRPTLPHPGLRA